MTWRKGTHPCCILKAILKLLPCCQCQCGQNGLLPPPRSSSRPHYKEGGSLWHVAMTWKTFVLEFLGPCLSFELRDIYFTCVGVVSLHCHAKGPWRNVLSLFGFIDLLPRYRSRCDSYSSLTTKVGERQLPHTSVSFIHPTLKHCNSTYCKH